MIEIMVVMAIGALMVAAVALTLRNVMRSDLRSAARRTAAAMRFAFDRATLTGNTVRLVFDLDKGEIWGEATEQRVTLSAQDSDADGNQEQRQSPAQSERKKRSPSLPLFGMGLGGGKEGEAEGEGEMSVGIDVKALTEDWERDLEPPRKPVPSFKRLKGPGAKRIKLASKIKIAEVVTPRLSEPIQKGKAQVYFFAQGRSEPAIIHFSYQEEDFYSVVLQPLTGQAKVYPCFFEIPSDFGVSGGKRKRSAGRDPCAAQGAL